MNEPELLPESWTWITVGDIVASMKNGIYKEKQYYAEHGIPCLRMYNIDDGKLIWEDLKRMILTPSEISEYSLLPGDLVVNRVNSRELVGKACVIPLGIETSIFESKNIRLRVNEFVISSKYLNYRFLQSGRRYFSNNAQQTVGMASVNQGQLSAFPIPLAPLNEQRRIVVKIEELFSDLDAGVAALERIKANLKRYRAAILKAAVEGKLTEQWRAKHPKAEPATKLLERILGDRRRKWEEDQLAKFAAAEREPPNNWRKKYVEPTPPDTTDLPELPKGWTVASVDQLTTTITSGSRDWTQYYGSGTGTFIMAQNVRKALLDLDYRQSVNPPPNDRDSIRSQVACNDLLVTIVGANTGDVCRVPSELPEHYVCQSVALMRPVVVDVAKYLEAYFVADHGGQKHFRRYIYGQGRPHLGFDELRMTPVVLPPLPEQEQVMAEVEERLSVIISAEQQIETNVKRAVRLRQCILKRAFEGKLVPQDPTDEPADKLLERIRQERCKMENGRQPSQRTQKANGSKDGPNLISRRDKQ